MEINFSNTDIIFIYGHFRKKAKELEELKTTPSCSFSKSDIDIDIQLYSSIADKLKDAVPSLSNLGE